VGGTAVKVGAIVEFGRIITAVAVEEDIVGYGGGAPHKDG
jgi:hypothetical protein